MNILKRYACWLHLKWPAGTVERLPKVGSDGRTARSGVYVVGDLTGVPLLKFSIDSGARAVRDLADDLDGRAGDVDVCIIGGGASGVSAAMECRRHGLSHRLLDVGGLFSTIHNFPVGKPIYTYPTDMEPAGELRVSGETREELLEELQAQAEEQEISADRLDATHVTRQGRSVLVHVQDEEPIRAKAAIIAIGRSGNFRRMDIPGEDSDKVSNRFHDPKLYCGKKVLVVGGGDSACEAAIALATCDDENPPEVTLSYRRGELSRPKPDNRERVIELAREGRIDLRLGTQPERIEEDRVLLRRRGGDDSEELANDYVLALIGREPPLSFFRRSGIPIHGEYRPPVYFFLVGFLLFAGLLYGMKTLYWFDGSTIDLGTWFAPLAERFQDRSTLLGTIAASATSMVFWVAFLYSSAVVIFGIDRMRRRRTPYVRVQTLTLMAIQVLPLFILPEILLPWADANGLVGEGLKNALFTGYSYGEDGSIGSYTAWWHAYGFILAWPLLVWIVFSPVPLWWWLGIGFLQTCVLIPLLIRYWGKGAYCGWICSCGALAETMGDRHREKMPHGLFWNKVNFVGQALLLIAVLILLLHIVMWSTTTIDNRWGWMNAFALQGFWKPVVDFFLAGMLGVGLYFWFSGRVWCRFACPLAALMHIYARFSRFRIVPETKKCISCNACTSVCHQGIDVMNFANKGWHMEDPECVRCSACVQTCPTNVLSFGQVDKDGRVIRLDRMRATTADQG
ncbi:MAG: FAD-dependent oxidoreductase [Planctomycetota bacterium]